MTDLERVELAAHRVASHYIVGTESYVMWKLFAAELATVSKNKNPVELDIERAHK